MNEEKYKDFNLFLNDLISRIECDNCGGCPVPLRVKTLSGDYHLKDYLKKYLQLKQLKITK